MTMGQVFKGAGCASLLAGLLCASGLANAQVVSASASPSPAVVGAPLALDVLIAGVADLYGYQFSLAFNPLVLQATGSAEGAFLPSAGATIFDGGTVNNTVGTVTLAFGTLTGAVPGASGSGVLASLNFNVIAAGISALTFSDVILLNSNLDTITAQISNGSVTAVPEPASYALFALGLAGLAALRQRKAG
jgi:Cohesin domain/PEP-CTERM motif